MQPVPREARFAQRRARRAARWWLFFWGVLLCGCGRQSAGAARLVAPRALVPPRRVGVHVPSVTGNESLTYRVRIDPALERIEVQLCPLGFRIERLNAPSPDAAGLLEGGKIITPKGDVPCAGEGADLRSTAIDECVSYAVHLPAKSPDPTGLRRVGQDRLASPDLWLWVPTPRPAGVKLRAHFELPAGVSAALPWPTAADSAPDAEFVVPETAFSWKAAGAFTHGTLEALSAPGSPELRWTALGDGFAHPSEVRAWIEQGAASASLLFGRFPVARALLLAVPTDRPGPAFGMALRGGGAAVTVFLDRRANAATLRDDWTCAHEFLHLGVPRLPPEDSWLFEGLASYYTELSRARAGSISPQQAYQHLLDGFERGRAAGER